MDKTLKYIICNGHNDVRTSSTNIYFLLNLPSILMSNIMCTLMWSYPGLIFPFIVLSGVTLSSFLNAIWKFSIYFAIALFKKLFFDCLPTSYTSFTVIWDCTPNLCDVWQYLDFTLGIILSRWRKVSLNHQTK